MIPPLELKVYPNPWGLHPEHLDDGSVTPTCDHEGRPSGSAFFEGFHAGTTISRRTAIIETEPRGRGDERSRRQRTIFAYLDVPSDDPDLAAKLAAKDPVSVPVSEEARRAIVRGMLIAGDEKTARFCKVAFEPAKTLLPKIEKAFGTALDRMYGEGADAEFRERRAHFRNEGPAAIAKPRKQEQPKAAKQEPSV
jgi:hypothetical protein